jgi:hypothetical protein
MVVGLDFGRFWPQRRVATGTIRRRNGLLMWELAGWRRRYHLLQRKRQTLDSIDLIRFNSISSSFFHFFNTGIDILARASIFHSFSCS